MHSEAAASSCAKESGSLFALILDTCTLRSEASPKSTLWRQITQVIEEKKITVQVMLPRMVLDEMNSWLKDGDEGDAAAFNSSIKHIQDNLDKLRRRELIALSEYDFDMELLSKLQASALPLERRIAKTEIYVRNCLVQNLEFLPYPSTSHEEIVQRLLDGRRPFKRPVSSGKNSKSVEGRKDTGYRDFLIWMAVLELVRECVNTKVIFVSLNTTEFADELKLHPDLLSDLTHDERDRFYYFVKLENVISFLSQQGEPRAEFGSMIDPVSGISDSEKDTLAIPATVTGLTSLPDSISPTADSGLGPFEATQASNIGDIIALAESEEVHDALFESLLWRLEQFDEDESSEWFFVRSTFTNFSLSHLNKHFVPFASTGSEFLCEAEYFATVLLLYHHNNRQKSIDHKEYRGLRVSARLILDLANKKLSNLSPIVVADEPVFECFVRARDIEHPGRGWSVRIIEPPEIAVRGKERVFDTYDQFVSVMVKLGAERDCLNRMQATGVANAFNILASSEDLLLKYGLIESK